MIIILFVIILFAIILLLIPCFKVECYSYMIDIPIYVISLERSYDRKKYIEKELGKYNMKFKYFDAVDGKNMTKEQFKLAERYISKYADFPLISGVTGVRAILFL